MGDERVPPNISRTSSKEEKATKLQGLAGVVLRTRPATAKVLVTYGQSIG